MTLAKKDCDEGGEWGTLNPKKNHNPLPLRIMKTYRRIFSPLASSRNAFLQKAAALPTPTEHKTGFQRTETLRPARKSRIFPSRPALATMALAMTGMSQAAIVSTVSVDFLGNFQPASLSTPDIAGVVPSDTWGVATGNTGFITHTDNLATDTVNVFWTAPDSNTIGNPSATNDQVMMDGYLMSGMGSTGIDPANLRISSIDLAPLGWAYYDVYVYSDTGTGSTMNQIDLYAPGVTNYSHDESSPGYGIFGSNTYFDSQISLTGNYVRYSGLTASMFDVSAYNIPGVSDATAINGIQIVGHNNVPEPSTGLLALLSTALLAFRRKRS